jgi:hypothetical protein
MHTTGRTTVLISVVGRDGTDNLRNPAIFSFLKRQARPARARRRGETDFIQFFGYDFLNNS